MRRHLHVLALALAAGAVASAQTASTTKAPARPAPTAVTAANLDKYLKSWEAEMKKVTALSAEINRADKDATFGTTSRYSGRAMYMKSGTGDNAMNLGLLELKPEGKTDIAEKVVCTGTYLYQFAPAQKEIKAYEMPRPKPGQVADDGFLGLLFGMKAEEAKRRYELKLVKEDQHYFYVEVLPRLPQDKADFQRSRLVLNKDNFLPRQLWFEQPNGDEVTWDLPRTQNGAPLDRKEFVAPQPPKDWKLVQPPPASAPDVPPRVIRQNQ